MSKAYLPCVCLDQPMNRLVLADIVGYMECEGASYSLYVLAGSTPVYA